MVCVRDKLKQDYFIRLKQEEQKRVDENNIMFRMEQIRKAYDVCNGLELKKRTKSHYWPVKWAAYKSLWKLRLCRIKGWFLKNRQWGLGLSGGLVVVAVLFILK